MLSGPPASIEASHCVGKPAATPPSPSAFRCNVSYRDRRRTASMSRNSWRLFWCLWLAVILSATTVYSNVFVGHSHWELVKWLPFHSQEPWDEYLIDLGQNLLLFFPLGYAQYPAGFAGSNRRLVVIALTGLFVSAGIELFQVYSHNRSPATTDIIMNGLGAWSGGCWHWHITSSSPPALAVRPHRPSASSDSDSQPT